MCSVGIEVLAKPIFGRGLPLPMVGAPCASRINGDFTRQVGIGVICVANRRKGLAPSMEAALPPFFYYFYVDDSGGVCKLKL